MSLHAGDKSFRHLVTLKGFLTREPMRGWVWLPKATWLWRGGGSHLPHTRRLERFWSLEHSFWLAPPPSWPPRFLYQGSKPWCHIQRNNEKITVCPSPPRTGRDLSIHPGNAPARTRFHKWSQRHSGERVWNSERVMEGYEALSLGSLVLPLMVLQKTGALCLMVNVTTLLMSWHPWYMQQLTGL